MRPIRNIVILLAITLGGTLATASAQNYRTTPSGLPSSNSPSAFPTNATRSSQESVPLTSRKLSPRGTSTSEKTDARSKKSSSLGSLATTLGGLAVVLLVIGGGTVMLRKHVPLATGILPPEVIQVLGRRFLDHRQCLQLIRIGNRILVVSHSPQHGLRTLSEITDPVEVDLLAGMCRPSEPGAIAGQFASLLWKSQAAHDEPPNEPANFHERHDRLHGQRPA